MPSPVSPGHGAPPLTVLRRGADNGNGDIFIAPEGPGYPAGAEILTNTGKVVWFHAAPVGDVVTDFRTQAYLGKPVLTWFQGSGLSGTDVIYNDHYQQIAEVRAGNGYFTDFHEFLITPWNTALILADALETANLTSMGGPADQKVFDGIVQEIDIRTGKVLFQWNSAGEVFAFQHDPEATGNNEYTLFDDESDGSTTLLSHSRVVTVKLDLATRVATLVKSVNQPGGLVAPAEGNAQTTRNGDLFVGWGELPYISEFSPSGRLLFNAQLPAGESTYRAYRLPWHPPG
jgi:hypothetical protein